MKKKIKNLTEEDVDAICKKHKCQDCPLHDLPYFPEAASCYHTINFLQYISKKDIENLENEVEVEE